MIDDDDEADSASRDSKKAKTENKAFQNSKDGETTLTEDDILPDIPLRPEILAGRHKDFLSATIGDSHADYN